MRKPTKSLVGAMMPRQDIDKIDELVEAGRYLNRSEMIRFAVRKELEKEV